MSGRKALRKELRTQADFIDEMGRQNRLLWALLSLQTNTMYEAAGGREGRYALGGFLSYDEVRHFFPPERWVIVRPQEGERPGFLLTFPPGPVASPAPPASSPPLILDLVADAPSAEPGSPDTSGAPGAASSSTTDTDP